MVPTLAIHLVVVSHFDQLTSIFRILRRHHTTSAAGKIFQRTFPATTLSPTSNYSISSRRPHHQVHRDLIYPPGGTPASTSDRHTSMSRSSLGRTPPRTSACGRMIHFSVTHSPLQTCQSPTRPPMPLVLPFDTYSCEFYAFLFSTILALCSCCTISSH